MKSTRKSTRLADAGTVGAAAVVSLIVALSSGTLWVSGAGAQGMGGQVITQQIKTGGYRLVLKVGPPQQMSMHGKKGERMLGGKQANCQMKGMPGMMRMQSATESGAAAATICNHHLEIHVYKGRSVVRYAHVSIAMLETKKRKLTILPVMTMVGANKGMSDYHYGNNIYAAPGDYTIQVSVNTASAAFAVHLI